MLVESRGMEDHMVICIMVDKSLYKGQQRQEMLKGWVLTLCHLKKVVF